MRELLDLCCGTGDTRVFVAPATNGTRATQLVGAEFSACMLVRPARAKSVSGDDSGWMHVFFEADALRMPFAEASCTW